MTMELLAGERERKGGARLEGEGEGEGVWGSAGAEHLAVEVEALLEMAVLGELPQLSVP